MRLHFILAGVLALTAASISAEELYRWVDKSGIVHYGNLPAADAIQVEQKKFDTAPALENAALPYETRRAQQNFPVTLYVSENCGDLCVEARFFLEKRGIPFTEKNLVTQEEMDMFKQASGEDVVPTLAIGRSWLKGFSASRWNDELDVAGYPKAAHK